MGKTKTYKAGKRFFVMNENMTLGQDEEAEKFYGKMTGEGGQIEGTFTNTDMKNLIMLILSPVNGQTPMTEEEVKSISVPDATQIVADFFVSRLRLKNSITESLLTSIRALQK